MEINMAVSFTIPPATAGSDLLTPDTVAGLLQVAKGTLEIWRVRRFGPRFCKVGRLVRYRRADIDAFIAARMVGGKEA